MFAYVKMNMYGCMYIMFAYVKMNMYGCMYVV